MPILVDLTQNEILLFSENPFYVNWNKFYEKHYLLEYILPNEDLDDLNIFRNNFDNIENYDFKNAPKKFQIYLKKYVGKKIQAFFHVDTISAT